METNVEYLFENNTIEEIQNIQEKLRQDVEKRKDDLKQIVGERYRDLIEASDTIQAMGSSCRSIMTAIDNLDDYCANASKRSTERCNDDELLKEKNAANKQHFSNLIKCKFIISTPSTIWLLLDENQIIESTFVYFEAKFVYKNAIDSLSNQQLPKLIKDYYKRVESFDKQILDHCWSELNKSILDDNADTIIARQLTCIALIENIDFEKLYEKFLAKQSKFILNSIDSDQDVCLLFEHIYHSLRITFLIFYDSSNETKSLLYRCLHDVCEKNYNEILNLFHDYPSDLIPKEIKDFRLTVKQIYDDIDLIQLRSKFDVWLNEMRKCIINKVNVELNKLNSINDMLNILLNIETSFIINDRYTQLNEFSETILSRNLSLWEDFLEEIVLKSITNILESKLTNCVDDLIEKINCVQTEEILNVDCIQNLIWQIDSNDNDIYLSYRAFGVFGIVRNFIIDFDSKLNSIITDLQSINERMKKSKMFTVKNIKILYENFYKIFEKLFKNFSNLVKQLIEKTSEKQIDDSMKFILFLSQLTRSLTQCCTHLRKCFDNDEQWFNCESDLLLITSLGYHCYFNKIFEEHSSKLSEELNFIHLDKFLENCLLWDEFKLEEVNEESGKTIVTVIHIPIQISLPLYNFLQNVVNKINSIAGYTLPNEIIVDCVFEMINVLCTIYSDIFESIRDLDTLSTSLKQTFSLQLYYDLLYLKQMLLSQRDEKLRFKAMNQLQKVITNYETLIDPFDLHVYKTKIEENLAKLNRSLLFMFGLLFQNSATAAVTTTSSASNVQQDSKHNLIPVYPVSSPFKLLEIKQ